MNSRLKSLAGILALVVSQPAIAQELPPIETYQAMLEANKARGWVLFRIYDGRQLVYFTPLLAMNCRLGEIRYSINSDDLDQTWPIPDCNPDLPFSLPEGIPLDELFLDLPPDTATTVSVQVSFTGGKKQTGVVTYEPCPNVGRAACARMVSDTE